MDELADYRPPVKGFNPIRNMVITETNRIICYDHIIYSDTRVEEDEYFSLTLIVQTGSATTTIVDSDRSSAVIKIVDDDDGRLHPLLLNTKLINQALRYC